MEDNNSEDEYSGISLTFVSAAAEWTPALTTQVTKERWGDCRPGTIEISSKYGGGERKTVEEASEGTEYVVEGFMDKKASSGFADLTGGVRASVICEEIPWIDSEFEVLTTDMTGDSLDVEIGGEEQTLHRYEVRLEELERDDG